MIVRDRPSGWQLFFILRGSILPRIAGPLLTTIGIAVAVTVLHGRLFDTKVTLTPIPFSLIGLALAIFLGFRNSASYDRWWEGRKLWGDLIIRTRSLARLWLNHAGSPPEEARLQLRRLIAFTYALKQQLRGIGAEQAAALLPATDWSDPAYTVNAPDLILRRFSAEVAAARAAGRLDAMMAAEMEENLTALASIQAGCERIRTTPLPFTYTLMLHRTAYLYCLMLPFGLVDTIGFTTPLVVGLISYTFFGLDALGDEIEEPFGLLPNDLPLDALCTRVEIDLRAALGETELPQVPQPVQYSLM
ncbi:MAG TPA: bestrophin family protein [Magnetospirillum sp.]|jgi:putative membrane protein|nr:bestrophin family protein [Magnetospirillum sp.]